MSLARRLGLADPAFEARTLVAAAAAAGRSSIDTFGQRFTRTWLILGHDNRAVDQRLVFDFVKRCRHFIVGQIVVEDRGVVKYLTIQFLPRTSKFWVGIPVEGP